MTESFSVTLDSAGRLLRCRPGPSQDDGPASRQLAEYLSGRRRTFDLSLAPFGTAFQKRVWAALCAIPYGQTTTYGALAAQLGSSPRAVGRAVATNPLAIFIPCHRVVGSKGELTGFAWGLPMKQALLELEARSACARSPQGSTA